MLFNTYPGLSQLQEIVQKTISPKHYEILNSIPTEDELKKRSFSTLIVTRPLALMASMPSFLKDG